MFISVVVHFPVGESSWHKISLLLCVNLKNFLTWSSHPQWIPNCLRYIFGHWNRDHHVICSVTAYSCLSQNLILKAETIFYVTSTLVTPLKRSLWAEFWRWLTLVCSFLPFANLKVRLIGYWILILLDWVLLLNIPTIIEHELSTATQWLLHDRTLTQLGLWAEN